MIAHRLSDIPEPGDGDVFRAVAEAQKRFYDAPLSTAGGKHAAS